MSFTRFVEIGRVALINYGEDEGKLCTIVDIIDGNRALIDGPTNITGVTRRQINFKRIALTDYKVKCGRNARQKSLEKAWKAGDIQAKWEASAWGQRLARRQARAAKSDFDRFVDGLEHKARSKKINAAIKA